MILRSFAVVASKVRGLNNHGTSYSLYVLMKWNRTAGGSAAARSRFCEYSTSCAAEATGVSTFIRFREVARGMVHE